MARQRSLALVTSEVFRSPTFDRMDDAHQIETLTKSFPHRWRHGQRDSVESLVTVLAYARDYHLYRKCGCAGWDEFCQRYYDGDAAGFDELIDGVRILLRDDWRGPISEADARDAAAQAMQQRDQQDRENQRPVGTNQHAEPVDNRNGDIHTRPTGTSVEAALRRLRKDRLDLHARVLSGELTANAAMIEAGFRKPRPPDPMPGLTKLRRAWKRASADERAAFLAEVAP